MESAHQQAKLYLNGVLVGTVTAHGFSDSWGYGQFTPAEAFARFALYFGAWSLLIHEDDQEDGPSPEALDELREAEAAIDSLRAELRWERPQARMPLSQLNIDGTLIEWKHR